MKKESEEMYFFSISGPLFVYISYLVFLSINDTISLGLFYTGIEKYSIFVGIAALGIVLLLIKCMYKRVDITRYQLDFLACFSVFLILVCGIARSIIPDLSYDTMNGRVFWQFPGFQNNIDYNVFPAGFTFFFPLSDRIFYYPRLLLGYRLGTLMNTVLLLLSFLETRALIKELLGDEILKIRETLGEKAKNHAQYAFTLLFFNESFLALIANMLFYAIANLGTYMIDLAGIPILLYLIRQLIKKEKDSHIIQLGFFAMLCGLCFALKFPNAVLIAPILLFYIIKNWKNLSITKFILCLCLGVAPAGIYLLYAYTSTGNPVYWTYNAIFKSPYYVNENFKDGRWGPEGIVDALLWPVKLVFNFQERVSEISKYPQIYILIGCISSVVILWKTVRKQIANKAFSVLAVIYGVMYILWLFSTGYPRYAVICEILAVIMFAIVMADSVIKGNRYSQIMTHIGLFLLVLQLGLNYLAGLNNEFDWHWRGTTASNIENGRLSENVKWLLRDRDTIGTDEQHEKVDIFLSMSNTRLFMKFFDKDIPIINASYILTYLSGLTNDEGTEFTEYYKNKIENAYEEGQTLYDIALVNEMEIVCEVANQWGVEIIGAENLDNYFDSTTAPILLEYAVSERRNNYRHVDNTIIDTILSDEVMLHLNGIVFLHPRAWENSEVRIVANSNGSEEVIAEFILQPGEFCDLATDLVLPAVSNEAQISINVVNGNPYTYAINTWLE